MNTNEGTQTRLLGPFSLYIISVLVGVFAGLGAVLFRGLIAFFHNLLFLGELSLVYDANIHTPPSPWGPFVILVPVVGALGVAFLVKTFAPEAKGHGVPEVMDAVYYNKGVIRPIVAVVKSLASAISIGSGGSIGREGPIIQIGSSFASTVGQTFRLPPWQRITLIAAGAGAGIAATFNTPIGGVLFAVEIMLHEVSVRTLVPVTIATAMATYIGRMFFGDYPSFMIPSFQTPYFKITNPVLLISYGVLGVILGVVSMIYIRSLYGFEDLFDKRVKGSYYRRHLLGMLLVGIMMYLLLVTTGHYYIQGVGYATIQDVLSGVPIPFFLLLLLAVLKLLATSLTLGSGASGGIFSPSLFLGATLGAAYGVALTWLFPGLAISPSAFAVAGMAGVVGGATGAAMAAIVMIFEMTLDYNVIVPVTLTVAISYAIRKMLISESIYTLKLARRGHFIPEALQTNPHHLKRAREIMDTRLMTVSADTSLDKFAHDLAKQTDVSWVLVEDGGSVVGIVASDTAFVTAARSGGMITLGKIGNKDHSVTVQEETPLLEVINKMRDSGADIALVTSGEETSSTDKVKGVITKQAIADTIIQTAELF